LRLITSKRLNFWGAVASIVGIPLAFALYWATPSGAGGDTVNVNSSGQRGGITANQVNVNASVKEKGWALRNVKYGATLVVDSPDIVGMNDPKRQVCLAPAGTPVMLTDRKADMSGIKDYWQEVMITAGNCANKMGWVERAQLSWE
jgi:hypothetical protein